MYHRVERLSVDPWQLAVPPDRFAEQISRLAEARSIVPLSWLAARIAAGRPPRHAAAVTFDDGYIDVFQNARPILEAAGCPGDGFPSDRGAGVPCGILVGHVARIILKSPSLPDVLEVDLPGVRHRIVLSRARTEVGLAALTAVHALLRPVAPDARDRAVADLAGSAGTDDDARPRDLAMTADQAADMASSGLIEIGAHTVTHPPVTSLAPADQVREASESRRRCEEIVGRRVSAFAYPYGDFDQTAASAIREAGLLYACSTVERAVSSRHGPIRDPAPAGGGLGRGGVSAARARAWLKQCVLPLVSAIIVVRNGIPYLWGGGRERPNADLSPLGAA